jgi:hypothetical protein
MLRLCVAQWANADPMALTVRDLRVEVPSDNGTGRARRLAITRSILRDFREGKPVPEIIIQPQMLVSVGAGGRTWFISADYLALGGSRNGYLPGEIKSHILTSNRGNSVEVRRTRLQAAVEILALRSECRRLGLEVDERDNRALLIFGGPYGVEPSYPIEERLDSEVYSVLTAIRALDAIGARLAELRQDVATPLQTLAPQLSINYEDSCKPICHLWTACKSRYLGQGRELGDEVSDLVGATTSLTRLRTLIEGGPPLDDAEGRLVTQLRENLQLLGLTETIVREGLTA